MPFAIVSTANGIVALDADGHAHLEIEGVSTSRLTRHNDDRCGVATGRVLKRARGTWEQIADVEDDLTCALPSQGAVFAGTRDGALLRIVDGEASRVTSFDTVEGREGWHAVPSGVPYVRSLSETADGALLANVHVGGVPRSTDGGETWTPTIDPDLDVHEVRAHPADPRIAAAAAGYGYAESSDGGCTWNVVTDGLHASYTRAVAFTSEAVLVTASNGPFNAESGVYRRAIGDPGPFEQVVDGLPHRFDGNIDTGCLDANGENAVLLDQGGAVFASGDDGTSWFHLADVPDARSVVLG